VCDNGWGSREKEGRKEGEIERERESLFQNKSRSILTIVDSHRNTFPPQINRCDIDLDNDQCDETILGGADRDPVNVGLKCRYADPLTRIGHCLYDREDESKFLFFSTFHP